MTLQQIPAKKRIAFLKLFTQELILSSIREKIIQDKISAEKLKQKFIQPNLTPEQAIQNTIKSSAFMPSKYPVIEQYEKPRIIQQTKPLKKTIYPIYPKQPLPKSFLKRIKKRIRREQAKTLPTNEPQTFQALQLIQPQYLPKPVGFNLGKIEVFLNDFLIQSIECPGPGKNILIKRQNKISPTRTVISQQEINNIINSFSQEAKIPIIGGILKAAVGNLIISAVVSEFVGSRFIISKLAPPQVQSQGLIPSKDQP